MQTGKCRFLFWASLLSSPGKHRRWNLSEACPSHCARPQINVLEYLRPRCITHINSNWPTDIWFDVVTRQIWEIDFCWLFCRFGREGVQEKALYSIQHVHVRWFFRCHVARAPRRSWGLFNQNCWEPTLWNPFHHKHKLPKFYFRYLETPSRLLTSTSQRQTIHFCTLVVVGKLSSSDVWVPRTTESSTKIT